MGYREKSALARELLDEKEKWEKVLASGDPDRGPEAQLNIGILWHRNLGILLNQLGDRDGARAAYQAAIDSANAEHGAVAAFNLGNILVNEGDDEGARAAYQAAIDFGTSETLPKAGLNLGHLLKRQEDVAGAERAYRLAADHGSVKATWCLWGLYREQGRLDELRAAYQAATGSSDQELASDALLLLGNMLVREGDMAGAKAHWERALAAAEPESESALRAAKLLALVCACPQNPLYRTGRRSRLPHGLQLVQGGTGLGHDRLDQLRARRQVNDQPRHLS
jgi:tetratricopeptide (TPR) repeat protein